MSASSHVRRRGRVIFPAPPGAAAITIAAFALAGCVGAGIAAQAMAGAPEPIKATDAAPAPPAPELVNPTGHTLRGEDIYGAGAFAPRAGTERAAIAAPTTWPSRANWCGRRSAALCSG